MSSYTTLHLKLRKYHKKSIRKLLKNHKNTLKSLKKNSVTFIGTAVFASSALTNISNNIVTKNDLKKQSIIKKDYFLHYPKSSKISFLSNYPNNSKNVIPSQDKNVLSYKEQEQVKDFLSQYFNIPLAIKLEGKILPNVSGSSIWGYFGQEQHLYRWPGDSLSQHINYLYHGIAPKYGAFGYFDNAKQEKYYIAVPLHLLPNWNTKWTTLKPWYRYRKVFVYNPKNNKAVVAVIGDVGPAKWTGKHFGASPEVMHYLNMVDGRRKSKAIVLFVNDKDDKIKLGPIKHLDLDNIKFIRNL